MKLPTASRGVSHGHSSVVALPIGCTQPQQAAGYSDKINNIVFACQDSQILAAHLLPVSYFHA